MASGKSNAEAVEIAGFEFGTPAAASVHASKLKAKPLIKQRLQEIASQTPGVADRVKIQQTWTTWMFDEALEMKDRLKASELLAKSQGFLTKHVNLDVKVEQVNPIESLADKLGVIIDAELVDDGVDESGPLLLDAPSSDTIPEDLF